MLTAGRRWLVGFAAVLLLIGTACSLAYRLPAVILGTDRIKSATLEASAPQPTLPPTRAATDTPPEPELTPAALETTPETPVTLTVREIEDSSGNPNFLIHASYPELDANAELSSGAFNRAAKSIVYDEIRAFKDSVYRLPFDETYNQLGSFLEISFSETANAHGILAIVFQVSFYMAGAAHPGHYSYALNYDLHNGQVLVLDDLFEPGSAYLERLSETCLQDLKARGRLDWEDGALPVAENYRVWNITPDGLLITFDEYQVASYAAGAQTVLIPYETLEPLLRTGSPLQAFLER